MFEIFHHQFFVFGWLWELKLESTPVPLKSAQGTEFRQAGVQFEAVTNSTTLHVTLQDGIRRSVKRRKV